MTQQTRLGFAGIGLMGNPLVARLLAAGHTVHVWNRSPDKLGPVVAAGAKPCTAPATLIERCDVIFLCLADTQAVHDVVFAEHGLATAVPASGTSRLVIDLSSIEPDATRDIAARLRRANGTRWVDAPVSGGVIGAEQGTLAVMAGGDSGDVDAARPLLEAFAHRCTHMGPVGAGQLTKLCNQMLVGCNVLVLAEVMALARRAGIDAARLPAALAGGFADSIPLQMTGPMMAIDAAEPVRWRVRTLLKDLDTAIASAHAFESATPLTELAARQLRAHTLPDADPATLVQLYLGAGGHRDDDV